MDALDQLLLLPLPVLRRFSMRTPSIAMLVALPFV